MFVIFFQLFLAIHATSNILFLITNSVLVHSQHGHLSTASTHCQPQGDPTMAHINYGRSRSVFLPLPFSVKTEPLCYDLFMFKHSSKNCMLQPFHEFFHVRRHRIQASSAQRLLTTLIDASCKLDKSCLVLRQATQ